MKIQYFIANESHIEGIIKLCNECFEENTSVKKALEIYSKNKNDPNQIYLVAICNNEIIAHTRIAIIPTIFDGMDTFAILNHVCVKNEYRKHKIGTKMLQLVEKVCKERGCTSLKLWSNNSRVPAHTCYKKFGFISNDSTFFSKEI